MSYRLLILFITCCLAFMSCKKNDIEAPPPDTEGNNTGGVVPPPTDVIFNVSKSKMLQLINKSRQAGCNCGATVMPPVAAVTWNDKLAKAAYDHSLDMKTRNYFSHTGINGTNAGQRITKAGYTWKAWGENIAKGYSTELAVVNGWLQSEGHCKNIMGAGFREMGVGREGSYWTQAFGTR